MASVEISTGDFDAYDALLHSIYEQTQSDGWFKSTVDSASTGVCLRIAHNQFRVFPYANPLLVPFEASVRAINPSVAVKLRSASIHAALRSLPADAAYLEIDANTRIQCLDDLSSLSNAEKDQCSAFIRSDLSLVLWSFNDPEEIITQHNELDEKLIKYIWRTRSGSNRQRTNTPSLWSATDPSLVGSTLSRSNIGEVASEAKLTAPEPEPTPAPAPAPTRRWFNAWRRLDSPHADASAAATAVRKQPLLGPLYAGLGTALAAYFLVSAAANLLQQFLLDRSSTRFFLLITLPVIFCVSIFFCLQLVGNLSLILGPVSQYHENSTYYSAIPPPPAPQLEEPTHPEYQGLPHITIHLPVYKESLQETIAPSIYSIKTAMKTYALQGGTSSIFICDDGLQLLDAEKRKERLDFYRDQSIGWTARGKHDSSSPTGFLRAGKFKKASNMNFGLRLSIKLEAHLTRMIEAGEVDTPEAPATLDPEMETKNPRKYFYLQQVNKTGGTLEERAMREAMKEIYAESVDRIRELKGDAVSEKDEEEQAWFPWASLASSLRMGSIILIIDADTVVPADCFLDAAREMFHSPELAIIQHESDVMQVANHYFENGITHFTRRINRCISYGCANGEVAPFVGHNAFLKWSAVQDASFMDLEDVNYPAVVDKKKGKKKASEEEIDLEKTAGSGVIKRPTSGIRKQWSESNVSEDFDLALRLLLKGYSLRWATYSKGGFKEGVSLTVVDELARWQKYAYGCDEIIFNPLFTWWYKGPISPQLSGFLRSAAPLHYKIGMMAYMFSYYSISASVVGSILNYLLLGLSPPGGIDKFYLHSFEIFLACIVVFPGLGNVGFTLLEYRIGQRTLGGALIENLRWVPFFTFFFGGLSIHLSTAILAHLFSYDMTWGSTGKEVEKSTFWIEVPRILRNFRFSLTLCVALIAMMIVLSSSALPFEWRITPNFGLIIPLAMVVGCHIAVPIVLNPWLMKFSF